MEERALVDRAKAGDRIAMSHLYEAHARRVYAVVRRLAGDDDLAADLSQDAWVRAFERLHLYRGDAAFGTWIHRLATNVALNRLRRRTKRRSFGEILILWPTVPLRSMRMRYCYLGGKSLDPGISRSCVR